MYVKDLITGKVVLHCKYNDPETIKLVQRKNEIANWPRYAIKYSASERAKDSKPVSSDRLIEEMNSSVRIYKNNPKVLSLALEDNILDYMEDSGNAKAVKIYRKCSRRK